MPAHASRTLAPAPSAPPSGAERRLLAPARPPAPPGERRHARRTLRQPGTPRRQASIGGFELRRFGLRLGRVPGGAGAARGRVPLPHSESDRAASALQQGAIHHRPGEGHRDLPRGGDGADSPRLRRLGNRLLPGRLQPLSASRAVHHIARGTHRRGGRPRGQSRGRPGTPGDSRVAIRLPRGPLESRTQGGAHDPPQTRGPRCPRPGPPQGRRRPQSARRLRQPGAAGDAGAALHTNPVGGGSALVEAKRRETTAAGPATGDPETASMQAPLTPRPPPPDPGRQKRHFRLTPDRSGRASSLAPAS